MPLTPNRAKATVEAIRQINHRHHSIELSDSVRISPQKSGTRGNSNCGASTLRIGEPSRDPQLSPRSGVIANPQPRAPCELIFFS